MADHEPTRSDGAGAPTELPFSVGWATSIGSLPHTDPVEAARLVLRTQPDLPAAPSLPQRSPLEGMLPQAMWGMPGVTIDADGVVSVDVDALDPEAPLADPGLQDEPFVGMQTFLREVAGRTAPIKAQLTGAVTLGLALTMYGVDEPLAFRLALHAVRERASGLLSALRAALPEAPLLVVVDEPALVGTAQLGFPLSTNEIIDLVSGVLAVLEPDATTGVHCCGEADWKAILMAGPQVLTLPVGAGFNAAAGAISAFMDRGGWIAWGAVPTSAPVGGRAGLYWKTLSSQWCELVQHGVDPVLIRRRSLVTPHCGLAQHGIDQAEHVLGLCGLVAGSLQEQAVSVKLSVGA
jgi:hypothetical protein